MVNKVARNQNLRLGRIGERYVVLPQLSLEHSTLVAQKIGKSLGSPHFERHLGAYWSLQPRISQWSRLLEIIPEARKRHYWELGSGMGLFTASGRMLGFNCSGLEPDGGRYQGSLKASQAFLMANQIPSEAIQIMSASKIPLDDQSVDVLVSFGVLEHVADLAATLAEAKRVLRPGGIFYAQCPNYRYPYEGHYGCFAPCFLGKRLTKYWLARKGRPTEFLDHLQWLAPASIRADFRKAGFHHIRINPVPEVTKNHFDAEAFSLPFGLKHHDAPPGNLMTFLFRVFAKVGRISNSIECLAIVE